MPPQHAHVAIHDLLAEIPELGHGVEGISAAILHQYGGQAERGRRRMAGYFAGE
jgi:hypothetical protein